MRRETRNEVVFPIPSLNDPHPYPRGLCLLFAPTVMSSTGVSALELESGKQLVHPGAPTCEAQGGQVRWESEGEEVSPVGPPGEGKASSRTPGGPQAGERVPPDATPHQPWERWRLPTDTPEPLAAAPPRSFPSPGPSLPSLSNLAPTLSHILLAHFLHDLKLHVFPLGPVCLSP